MISSTTRRVCLPLYLSKVSAGFPSPAEDEIADTLDLNRYLVKRPAATYFVRATGHTMVNAGIREHDILIVDRSVTPTEGKIVIAALEGKLCVRRLRKNAQGNITLATDDASNPVSKIREDSDFVIWGVVIHIIHSV